MELDLDTVTEMIISLSRAVKYNMKPEVYEPLSGLMNGIKSWIQQQSSAIKQVRKGFTWNLYLFLYHTYSQIHPNLFLLVSSLVIYNKCRV